MSKYYVGDIGTEILVDTTIDISLASSLILKVRKPSGRLVEWTGLLGPANALGEYTTIRYVVVADDWDEGGIWKLQAYVVTALWRGRGETVTFKLEEDFN
jgi:hypothetical protein